MGIAGWGALCFGLVIGWITYRTLRHRKEDTALSDIAAVIAAVGGSAVTALFKSELLFGAYCLGLSAGFFLYFIASLLMYGKKQVGLWMGEN